MTIPIVLLSSTAFAICLVITALNGLLLKDLYGVYKTLKLEPIKSLIFSITFFMLGGLLTALLNLAILVSADMWWAIEDLISVHEISVASYNLFVLLGFSTMLRTFLKQRSPKLPLLLAPIPALTPLNANLVISVIIAAELALLIKPLIKRTKTDLISGTLWTLSLILIMFGRLLFVASELFALFEYSYVFMIYFDLFAFTSLYIMSIEVKLRHGA